MIDERFLMHRLKSSSLASMTGAAMLGAWILYQFYAKDIFRWDCIIILTVMVIVNLTTMTYLRIKN